MNNKGFTLIETLAVIVIIGILALTIMPRVLNIRDDAEQARAESDLRNLQTQLEMNYLREGNFPEDTNDLTGDLKDMYEEIDGRDYYNIFIVEGGNTYEIRLELNGKVIYLRPNGLSDWK